MRRVDDKSPVVITSRTGYSRDHGRYGLGYRDAGRVITALKSSGELVKSALMWADIELVNVNGKTMAEMVTLAPEIGFALRHRTEFWYWSYPNNGRVWYRRAGDVERIWRITEARYAVEEDREERRSPRVQKLEMVRCRAGSGVESLPNWLV